MKNKGFTLIEVLGVVIVLGIIGMIVYPKALETINDSRKKSYSVSTKGLVELLNNYALDKKATLTSFDGCGIDFDENSNSCIDIEYSGKLPSSGSLYVDRDGNVNGSIVFDKYSVDIDDGKISELYIGIEDGTEYVFNYTGSEQTLNVRAPGYYKLEVWGAQGGDGSSSYRGGYGGYSSGFVKLHHGTVLFINVGGQGVDNITNVQLGEGGYNGGGAGYSGDTYNHVGSGGGATHIALKAGVLSSFDINSDGVGSTEEIRDILIVAGGGGGGYYHEYGPNGVGGDAGGYVGKSGTGKPSLGASGGTQSTGGVGLVNGSFGQGASNDSYWGNGGGGGFYGGGNTRGGNANQNYNFSGAGGGSGYIGNSSLIDKSMYCYGCTETDDASTKTISTTNVSKTAISNYAKEENGYAKITYVGKNIE